MKPVIVIPMAGLGQRFVDAGYKAIKPLLPVMTPSGQSKPMVVNAALDLFQSTHTTPEYLFG